MAFSKLTYNLDDDDSYSLGSGFYGTGTRVSFTSHNGYDAQGIQALIRVLREYDMRRTMLETKGGSTEFIKKLTALINMKVNISGDFGEQTVCLSQPDVLKASLYAVGQTDLKFTVRRLDYGLPSYYIARVRNDYWGIYSLVVEDVYLSPDYPIFDPRFIRLMKGGKEQYYLRLSLFRDKVTAMLNNTGKRTEAKTDSLLYDLGRYIFQGSWHIDQRFAFVFADIFGLPNLRNAIELVYLSLSCDLSALRRCLSPSMHAFFEKCYANQGIGSLLNQLESMSGAEMSAVSRRGLVAYQQLTNEINTVFDTPFEWTSSWHGPLPLWKILVANVNRLDMVAKQLAVEPELKEIVLRLENSAAACIGMILEKDAADGQKEQGIEQNE